MTTARFQELVQSDIKQLCKEAQQRYEAGVPLPQGWPTIQEQRDYWAAKTEQEQSYELNGGVNDWRYDDEQYTNEGD